MENKFRIPTESLNEPKVKSAQASNGKSMFSGIEKKLKLESYFEEGFPVKYLPKILFCFFLCLIYIGNSHYAEKTIRKIDRTQTEVEDLRADFTTLKSDVMFASKQSEVAKRVKSMGLEESLKPPFKVVVEKGEY